MVKDKNIEKCYNTLEDFPKKELEKIEQALKDVDEGRYSTLEEFVAEMEEKYGLPRPI